MEWLTPPATDTERRILEHVLHGKTDSEIIEALGDQRPPKHSGRRRLHRAHDAGAPGAQNLPHRAGDGPASTTRLIGSGRGRPAS